jgi:hypothetical protein
MTPSVRGMEINVADLCCGPSDHYVQYYTPTTLGR